MAPTFTQANKLMYGLGQQTDIIVSNISGSEASGTQALRLENFEVQKEPEIIEVVDSQGNRSAMTGHQEGHKVYPFSFSSKVELNQLAFFMYHNSGQIVTTQDGATGAYAQDGTFINSSVLPTFTAFYNLDALAKNGEVGLMRLRGCTISDITITASGSDFTMSGTGVALGRDENYRNNASQLTALGVTDATYQSNGLIRYQYAGATDLSTVKNGDVVNITDTGFTNPSNLGSFRVVTVDDASDFIDVINTKRTDNTDDETSITSDNTNTIDVLNVAVYFEPKYITSKEVGFYTADSYANLDSADCLGLGDFSITVANDTETIYEKCLSDEGLVTISKAISMDANGSHTLNTTRGNFTEETAYIPSIFFRIKVESQNGVLGSSVALKPLVQFDFEAMDTYVVTNQGSADKLMIDHTFLSENQQEMVYKINNELASITI